MYTFLMQDWVTIKAAPGSQVAQSVASWMDLAGYQDIVGWVDVKNMTVSGGAITFGFETSPTQDDTLMVLVPSFLADDGHIAVQGPGVLVATMLTNNPPSFFPPSIPLSRWLRWAVVGTGTSNWDITFRVFVCANAGGGRGRALSGTLTAPSIRAGVPTPSGAPGAARSPVHLSSPSTPLHLSNPRPASFTARSNPVTHPITVRRR